jgi:hypothetical protein
MHQRTVIRNQMREALFDTTECRERVYVSRMQPLIDNLPAINIYTLLDTNDVTYESNTAPVEQKRELEIVVNIKQQLNDYRDATDVATYIDDIALQVETLVARSNNLNKTCAEIYLSRTQIFLDDTCETMVAGCDMVYLATYYLKHTQDTHYLDDFITAHSDINHKLQTFKVNK